jgi:hypothetical protein
MRISAISVISELLLLPLILPVFLHSPSVKTFISITTTRPWSLRGKYLGNNRSSLISLITPIRFCGARRSQNHPKTMVRAIGGRLHHRPPGTPPAALDPGTIINHQSARPVGWRNERDACPLARVAAGHCSKQWR